MWKLLAVSGSIKLRSANGTTERHKAHLLCSTRVPTEVCGQDYDETFSPVVRFESLRTVIALAV